ncbi:hypothetical protein [Ochrobactrum sp. A-1]|uniref:hypothetical protein n=1 Tax=Ochrobactrum sp. A-1 TaxID=2920940 RepID=UPI0018A8B923|nr:MULTISPECIES: hypothetical protein [unclassified Ochrobactrum]MCH4538672.1 hypothetical protein [Ochrobactrum sp. A-1]
MKSWGVRLVAGLKNWRTRKEDAVPDAIPDSGHAEQPDQVPTESIEVRSTGFNEKASRGNPQYADVQKADHSDEPKTLETSSGREEQTDQEINEPSTLTSTFPKLPKQSRARISKTAGQPTKARKPAEQARARVDETSNGEGLARSGIGRADQELKKRVTGKVLTKSSRRTGNKALVPTGRKNSPPPVAVPETTAFQEPSTHGQFPQTGSNGRKCCNLRSSGIPSQALSSQKATNCGGTGDPRGTRRVGSRKYSTKASSPRQAECQTGGFRKLRLPFGPSAPIWLEGIPEQPSISVGPDRKELFRNAVPSTAPR